MSEEKTPIVSPGFLKVLLLIVVTILIIANIVIGIFVFKWIYPIVTNFKEARIAATKTNMIKIKEGIQIYKMYKDKYPNSLKELVPKYIQNAGNLKDAWGQDFYYKVPGKTGEFDLTSGGLDGDIKTPKDNINICELLKEDKK